MLISRLDGETKEQQGPRIPADHSTSEDKQPIEPAAAPQNPSLHPESGGNDAHEAEIESATASAPVSPYTANRQLIHTLTLPTIPNVVIPPSPPGTPRASTANKFQRFLELKGQGTHFNTKLAASSQLKNPSLFQNLTQFAGIGSDHDQYACTLPDDLTPIPKEGGFPRFGYWEQLNKAQQDHWRRKEMDKSKSKRDAIDFVSGGSAQSSQSSTPHGTAKSKSSAKNSAAERVMAGLDREKSRSPHPSGEGNQQQRQSRVIERHRSHGRRRSRSRSPKRRKDK